ncbi:MAG TPA: DUF4139 domain-containing protein [Chitinispirillaceae bacterium]|nr:DUF4139 domain-containing protein [Chitinispirillaceae bacterium]
MIKIFLFLFLITRFVPADIAVPEESRIDLKLTAYRDFGMITDKRKVQLPKGISRIRFVGVATEIKASSVLLETSQKSKLDIISQSYEFDLVSPSKLMEKYIGKELEIIDQKEDLSDTTSRLAELISVHGEEPVFRIGTKITFGHIGQLFFPYMPDNLYTRPTLLWDLESEQRQEVELTASYLTDCISWSPEYKLLINDKENTAQLSCWITFSNKSGTDYKDAVITFVDGNIKIINNGKPDKNLPDAPCFYSVDRPVTLLNNQMKQIEWINISSIQTNKSFKIGFMKDEFSSKPANVVIQCVNKINKKTGFSLPGGNIQIFKYGSQSQKWFVGEDLLDNVAVNKHLSVEIGIDNDIRGRKAVLSSEKGKTEYSVEIKNSKNVPVEIKVTDYINNRRVLSSSQNYRLANSYIEWSIRVGAGETVKLSYSLD